MLHTEKKPQFLYCGRKNVTNYVFFNTINSFLYNESTAGSLTIWNRISNASYISILPIKGSPILHISLIVSVAWIQPITPGRIPNTPKSLGIRLLVLVFALFNERYVGPPLAQKTDT